ncbi:MAG: hypothetical protein EB078_13550, partial [Proteobacteria bacterium]|nr:hypothetical protein [Pseudomonadota bacterium]
IFLFDKDHDSQFLVSSRPLSDFSGTKIDFPFVETRFREAFTEVMRLYHEEQYQPLPGSQSEPPQVATNTSFANRPDPRLAAESRALFRELSSQTDSSFRLGAQIGMARFSSQGTTASNVAFGLAAGYDLFPRFSLEAGFSLASYLMAQGGIRYLLPFAEKQVKLSIGVEVANVISPISQNVGYVSQGFSYESPPIPRGSFFAGPGIFFEIPLLGAGLRGDLRMYFGNGTILMGTYGFVYHI